MEKSDGATANGKSELGPLLRLSGPIALAHAGNALMGVVDTAVVGHSSSLAQGAVGIGNGLYFLIGAFGMGLMAGIDPLISQSIGAGDSGQARRYLWQGAWLALAAATAISLVMAAATFALAPLGVPAELASEASRYLWWRIPGLFPMLLFMAARGYLQGLERPGALVVATVVGNVFNLVFDVLLVFGGSSLPDWTGPLKSVPALGVVGAAITTSACLVLQLAIVVVAISRVPVATRVPVALDLPVVLKAVRVGAPIGLQIFAEVLVFAGTGIVAGTMGEVSVAAHQVAVTCINFTFCLALGVAHAGCVRVGLAIGAGDTAQARRRGFVALGTSAGVMGLTALALTSFSPWLSRWLSADPAVQAVATRLFLVGAAFQLADGLAATASGALRGAGETRYPFIANLFGYYALGMPVALVVGLHLGLGIVGLWWGLFTGLTTVAIALIVRFVRLTAREIAPLVSRGEVSGAG